MKPLPAIVLVHCMAALTMAAPILAPFPASAAVAPEFYAAARDRAPEVIVFDVTGVTPAKGPGPGWCHVAAHITAVERGQRYKPGQRIKVPVHCFYPGQAVPNGGALYVPIADLTASKQGRAFMESGYPVLDQYDILPAK